MAAQQDEIFKAMADPHRRQILGELCRQSREAGELARMVGLAPNAVSFHLRALKAADLVRVRREGRFLRYSLEPASVLGWRSQVDRLFPSDLLGAEAAPGESVWGRADQERERPALDRAELVSEGNLPTELL
jgi:DNA-binding transcriptional ArsR family regulator